MCLLSWFGWFNNLQWVFLAWNNLTSTGLLWKLRFLFTSTLNRGAASRKEKKSFNKIHSMLKTKARLRHQVIRNQTTSWFRNQTKSKLGSVSSTLAPTKALVAHGFNRFGSSLENRRSWMKVSSLIDDAFKSWFTIRSMHKGISCRWSPTMMIWTESASNGG